MVDKKNPETKDVVAEPQKHNVKKFFVKVLVVVVLVAAGYGMWKNPQIVEQIKTVFSSSKEDVYQQQIDEMQNKMAIMQRQIQELSLQNNSTDLSEFEDKFSAMEKMNLNVIDSKADVATVLGIITRMDKAEQKIEKLANVSDESALTLTALMLVKDSAERGGNFEYEAEVLSEVVKGNPKLQEKALKIESFAKEGILSERELVKSFDKIYASMLKQQKQEFEKTWKERINSKLQEFVQIKKVNEKNPKFEADKQLQKIKNLVDEGNLTLAAKELENPQNAKFLENQELKNWLEKAKNRDEFYDIISSMSASSLAIMKVRFLKKNNAD